MTTSRTTSRLIIVLLFLAGLLLLRKPVFGQAITAAPTRFSVVIQGAAPSKGHDVILIPGLSSSADICAPAPPTSAPLKLFSPAGRARFLAMPKDKAFQPVERAKFLAPADGQSFQPTGRAQLQLGHKAAPQGASALPEAGAQAKPKRPEYSLFWITHLLSPPPLTTFFCKNSPEIACQVPEPSKSLKPKGIWVEV